MSELVELLNEYAYRYYTLDEPTVADAIESGTHLIVLTCSVTSSPSTPFPLVAALSSLPSR